MPKLGYLGPEGSYSSLAAAVFRPKAEHVPYGSFNGVMQALLSGGCDLAVLPVENSLNGEVNQSVDVIQGAEKVIAFEEAFVKIDHRLATLKGADIRGISRIYSHRQALEQCGKFIAEHFPDAKTVETPSTAAGLEMLKTGVDACIVGAHTRREGVVLSEYNIADEKFNVTQFLLLKRGGVSPDTASRKIYFSATCRHESGALLKLLTVISDGGLNMTKIQSRPIKDRPGEYRFFIELAGNYASENVKRTLERVKSAASGFKLLGVY